MILPSEGRLASASLQVLEWEAVLRPGKIPGEVAPLDGLERRHEVAQAGEGQLLGEESFKVATHVSTC